MQSTALTPITSTMSPHLRRLLFRMFLVFVAVLALAAAPSGAQAQVDVIRGRVTNSDGLPLAAVRVTATSIPGGVTREARTNNQGSFQILFPGGPGDYMMGYALIGYDFKQFQVKRLADEDVLLADAQLSVIQLDEIVVVAPERERVSRNAPTVDVGGTEQTISAANMPPEMQGDIAAMAASLPGVLLQPGLDGAPDGYSVLGLDADQNATTLNGMPTGASNLPRDASVTSTLTTSPYDPSRGGFSGAGFNIRANPGSNFRSRGTSLVMTSPQVQWTDRAAQALANEYTNLSLGGTASGPLKQNRSFYNFSYQLGRQSRDYQTLLTMSPLGLQTAGIASDSVSRFLGILQGAGIPSTAGPVRSNRLSDSGSLLGSIDVAPPNSTTGQSYGFTANGSWRRQTPTGGSQLSLQSTSGDRTSWSGGLQARHTGYFGMVLSESSAGLNVSRDYDDPYLDLPAGRVRVNSVFEDGESGVQTLSFGGSTSPGTSSTSSGVVFQNTLSWFDNANKHRLKLATEFQFNRSEQEQGSNLLGTYTFNSLADFEAGRPASFSRTLSSRERSTGQWSAAVSLGDSYRRTTDLQFQYGLRADFSGYTSQPANNPLVESTFGTRNDNVPTSLVISPRLGFSWTLGRAPEIGLFTGAAAAPRAVIRGGIGLFANNLGVDQIGASLDNTGLPSGIQQIMCVGPAVPIPDWDAYAEDRAAVPDRCADGSSGTVFSNSAPNVTLFSEDFAPQKSVRSNLSWNGGFLDNRFTLNVEGSYSLNLGQRRFVDLNFADNPRFTLDDGRPVFVEPTSIVPATGSIASRDARVSQDFARVSEQRSDLRSRTAQLSLRLSPIVRGPQRFGWSAGYTYTNIREQVSGFSSTASNPLSIQWATAAQGPHQLSYSLRYNFFDAVQVSWSGSFRSGSAFTPGVAGDVNGDGYSNDRAYIYSPGATDRPELAAEMAQLLGSSSSSVRSCLEKQINRIAGRNSCRGPWTSGASLNITLDRAKFRMPHRAAVSFSLSNPLGAADLLVNGSENLRGWGQSLGPDASLLYVRGFDEQTRRFRYEVNQRFGATNPQVSAFRSPVMLTASVRIDLGPTRERQNLINQLNSGRRLPGSRLPEALFRSSAGSIPNPLATILRSQDTLQLTALQADSIAAMNRRYTYRADSLWSPAARYFSTLPNEYDSDDAYARYQEARRAQFDMLEEIGPAVRELLTSEQKRKLPPAILNYLDPRYLASIRNGTGTYLGGGGGAAPIIAGGGDFVGVAAPAAIGGGGGGEVREVIIIRQ